MRGVLIAPQDEDSASELSTIYTVILVISLNQQSQQLAESFCLPVLLYNAVAVNMSKSECARLEHVWNAVLYKIYGVSGDMLNFVYAYTNCLPVRIEILLRQCTFLRKCYKIKSNVLQYVYDVFGRQDLQNCMQKLHIDDLYVHKMSAKSIRRVVLDRFVHSVVK